MAEREPTGVSALLFGRSGFGGGVGILFGEALYTARGVKQFLFAGEEGVAIRADFHAQHVALDGRARLKGVAAGAVHRHGMIIGMNTGFHGAAFRRVRSARPTRQSRAVEAVTKRRSHSRVARSRAILNHTRRVKFRKTQRYSSSNCQRVTASAKFSACS